MECEVATSGSEGLELLRGSVAEGKPFDIVITDLVLPGMDGFQLREVMSKDPDLSKIITLLVTGHDLKDQGREALKAGFAAYLTKPLEQARLFNAISQVLTHKKLGQNGKKPVVQKNVQPVVPVQNGEQPDLSKDNLILLAEDNPVNQKVATLQLRQLGLSCVAVNNGKEAVEELARGSYALVLMDCQMPVMDGFQATRAIRDSEALTGLHIPIIGLTAYAMEADRDRCISAGMDDYVSKPSSFAKLSAALQRWLPNYHGEPVVAASADAGAAASAVNKTAGSE
jgi:CheY-like chemotaxis protein